MLTQSVAEVAPILTQGGWVQQWQVEQLSSAAAAAARASYEENARLVAGSLLRETDAIVIESVESAKELHPDLIAYRAALRSPETLPGYPVAPVFPAKPSNVFAGVVDLPDDFTDAIN